MLLMALRFNDQFQFCEWLASFACGMWQEEEDDDEEAEEAEEEEEAEAEEEIE
ncbi:hypothetical protein T11_11128 [Trichinella zimbabwensis]|uniref:Uncharacterized protein n=1 Tax=Trichinella zimbabwensis TaxID=268475 RepID=A0A0V1HHB0_9BILA|nr:hypothetical protein T11_11128 [Trichinella zimbabwensis]